MYERGLWFIVNRKWYPTILLGVALHFYSLPQRWTKRSSPPKGIDDFLLAGSSIRLYPWYIPAGNISCLQLNGKNIPFIFYIAHIFCRHTILCCALITTNISIFNKKDFTEHPKSLYPQEPGSAGSLKRSVIWLSLSRFKTSPHIRPSPLDNMYKIF